MAVVDVGTVEGDDVIELSLQGLPHGLDAQHLARGEGGESRPSGCELPLPPDPEGQSAVDAAQTQRWPREPGARGHRAGAPGTQGEGEGSP